MKVWPVSTRDLQTSYIFLQSVESVIQVKYFLHYYFWSRTVMYVLLWLNTAAAVEMFFIFVFFMKLFWKKMRIMLSASKPHFYSRLSKSILKILPIYRKNILGKQLSQAICPKYFFRLLDAPKFQIFPKNLNTMVKVVKLFTGVLWKSCSDEFYRKTPLGESLFK